MRLVAVFVGDSGAFNRRVSVQLLRHLVGFTFEDRLHTLLLFHVQRRRVIVRVFSRFDERLRLARLGHQGRFPRNLDLRFTHTIRATDRIDHVSVPRRLLVEVDLVSSEHILLVDLVRHEGRGEAAILCLLLPGLVETLIILDRHGQVERLRVSYEAAMDRRSLRPCLHV